MLLNGKQGNGELIGSGQTIPLLREAPETFRYEKETTSSGRLRVKGILQKAATLNQNKRIYPLDILRREVDNYQKLIEERRSYGELDHPLESVIALKNTSHIITKTWWQGNELWGEAEILNTDSGRNLKALFEADCTVGISSRGVGSTQHVNGADVVQGDFMLICWDFVSEPSTPNAFMFKENKEIPLALVENYFRSTGQLLHREVNRIKENYEKMRGGR